MKQRPYPYKSATSGFTLVEMLVVIAIIILLAALITPATTHALGNARKAKCTSNLGSASKFFSMYAANHGGRTWPLKQTWVEVLHDEFPEIETALFCPEFQKRYSADWEIGDKDDISGSAFSMHSGLADTDDHRTAQLDLQRGGTISTTYCFLEEIPSHSQMPLLFDGDVDSGDRNWAERTANFFTEYGSLPKLHRNQLNVVYVDGHVEDIGGDYPDLYNPL